MKATDFIDLKNFTRTVTVLAKKKPNGIKQTSGEGGGEGRSRNPLRKAGNCRHETGRRR